jgi:fructoselysine 3-epimerase
MKISLSSFVYFYYPLEEAIRKTAEAGFDGIDIWGGRPHAYRRDLQPEEIRGLRALLEQHHLAAASFIPAQFRYPTNLCSSSETIRLDSIAYIQDGIQLAAGLGAPVVSVCPGHTLAGQPKADAWGRLRASLVEVCRKAQKYGIRIAIEPADAYETDLMNTVSEAMQMVTELEISNLGVLLDSGHAHVVGEPFPQAVQAAGDRLYHVHVDDNNGKRDQHLVPGEGTCDFTTFLQSLDASGYQGFLAAELSWDYILDPDPAARESARRMRDWVATGRTQEHSRAGFKL